MRSTRVPDGVAAHRDLRRAALVVNQQVVLEATSDQTLVIEFVPVNWSNLMLLSRNGLDTFVPFTPLITLLEIEKPWTFRPWMA